MGRLLHAPKNASIETNNGLDLPHVQSGAALPLNPGFLRNIRSVGSSLSLRSLRYAKDLQISSIVAAVLTKRVYYSTCELPTGLFEEETVLRLRQRSVQYPTTDAADMALARLSFVAVEVPFWPCCLKLGQILNDLPQNPAPLQSLSDLGDAVAESSPLAISVSVPLHGVGLPRVCAGKQGGFVGQAARRRSELNPTGI